MKEFEARFDRNRLAVRIILDSCCADPRPETMGGVDPQIDWLIAELDSSALSYEGIVKGGLE